MLSYHCNLLICRFWPGIANVIGYGSRKEKWNLRDNSQLAVIALQVKAAYVASINQQLSTLKLVETSNETCQTGFSCAGMPNNCHCLTRLNAKIKAGQDGLSIVVAEKYVFEFDFADQVSYLLLVDLMNAWLGIDQG